MSNSELNSDNEIKSDETTCYEKTGHFLHRIEYEVSFQRKTIKSFIYFLRANTISFRYSLFFSSWLIRHLSVLRLYMIESHSSTSSVATILSFSTIVLSQGSILFE